jgi:predicted transcriptional regulator
MAGCSTRRIALLSIHPRHADNILNGSKAVELRRVPISDETSHVVIYATSPVCAVVGWFEVEGVDRASRSAIWETHGATTGVTRREFRRYFEGAAHAVAIRVRRPTRLATPVALDSIPGVSRPPQSFQYLEAASVAGVLDLELGAVA